MVLPGGECSAASLSNQQRPSARPRTRESLRRRAGQASAPRRGEVGAVQRMRPHGRFDVVAAASAQSPLIDPRGRVVIVGTDDDWIRTAVAIVNAHEHDLTPEAMRLNEGTGIDPPVVGALIHVDAPDSVSTEVLRPLARNAISRQSVVTLTPFAGAAVFRHVLDDLGYDRILVCPPRPRERGRYWTAFEKELTRLTAEHLALIPMIAHELGTADVEILRLVEASLVPTPTKTVTTWRKRLERTHEELVGQLEALGFPPPKVTVDTIWLALAVQLASVTGDDRVEVARACACSSGDYLGKKAKALTGLSFGDLVDRGLGPVLARLKSG